MKYEGEPCTKCGNRLRYVYGQCVSCKLASVKQWQENNLQRKKDSTRRWRENNIERVRRLKKQWRGANLDKEKQYRQRRNVKFLQKNGITYNAAQRRKRRTNDLAYKELVNRQRSFCNWIKGTRQNGATTQLVGCTPDQFHIYIDKQLTPKMRRAGRGSEPGKWVIDHKVNLAFILKHPEYKDAIWHHTNCWPVWWEENLRKADRLDFHSTWDGERWTHVPCEPGEGSVTILSKAAA